MRRMPTPDIHFQSPFGELILRLWPRRRNETLRAWGGADRYLLEHARAHGRESDPPTRWLVLNDTAGALALALPNVVASSGDSWIAREAMLANARDNGREPPSWCWPGDHLPGADAVLMKLPKDLSLLTYQLRRLVESLPAGTPIALGGMDKHLPPTLAGILERYLDDVVVSRGQYKARLFTGTLRAAAPEGEDWPWQVPVPPLGVTLTVQPGVFAGDRFDIGARFLIEHLPGGISGRIADLGCGNGVVGLAAGLANPEAEIWFCDESAQAVRTARENTLAHLPAERCHFHHGNGLDGLDITFDLILLNPPFHRGHAVDDGVATMLFRHARRQLARDGELRVIGNRHLGYQVMLRKLFGRVEQVAANSKFVIWRCGS